jgi:hypothetical protein
VSLPAGIIAIEGPTTLSIWQLSAARLAGSRCVRPFPIAAFAAAPIARFAFPREAHRTEHDSAGVASLAGEASVLREKLVTLLAGQQHINSLSPATHFSETCGLERPTIHFGHGTVCKSGVAPDHFSALPASKLCVAPCATSMFPTISPRPWVTLTVTVMVTCVFHAPVTFPHKEGLQTFSPQ